MIGSFPPANIQRAPYIPPPEQRVEQRVNTSDKQRVERFTNISVLTRITDAPPIMDTPNPTQKCTLKLTKRIHSKRTWNNMPGSMLLITPTALRHLVPVPTPNLVTAPRQSPCTATPIVMPPSPMQILQICFIPIKGGCKSEHYITGGFKFSY
jgi:hypothetical protein